MGAVGAVGAVVAFAGPIAYSVDTAHTGGIVNAGPSIRQVGPPPGGGMRGGAGMQLVSVSDRVAALLSADRTDDTWVAATSGSTSAASYQLAKRDSVLAIGDFGASGPWPTLALFQKDVSEQTSTSTSSATSTVAVAERRAKPPRSACG